MSFFDEYGENGEILTGGDGPNATHMRTLAHDLTANLYDSQIDYLHDFDRKLPMQKDGNSFWGIDINQINIKSDQKWYE